MRHRPILVDVMAMAIDDHQMADTEVLLEGLDVSAILASSIGRVSNTQASWADLKWTKRADEIAGRLRIEEKPSPEVLEGIARALLDDPAFRSAIVVAARTPRTGGLDALRACSAIEAADAARKSD